MSNMEAVDAKLERASGQSRRLKGDVAAFCQERSRLILPERCGDRRLWVYRGGDPSVPVRWSVRVGEFAHNLRSALDQLVWQLAAAHGRCAGQHDDGRCPGRHSEFPIRTGHDSGRLDLQLCGVGTAVRAYIESVQPPRRHGRLNSLNGNRIGRGLGVLRDICNRDKHQTLLKASVRWTGQWPMALGGGPLRRAPRAEERMNLDPGCGKTVETVGHELQYGEALLITTGWPDGQRLEFPVDAYFDHLPYSQAGRGQAVSVAETLDACMGSVEMVVSRLREEP